MVAVVPQRPEDENVGFHRVRRQDGLDLETLDVVPGVELQIVHVEIIGKSLLVHGEQGGNLLGDRSPDQGGGKILEAAVGAHQGGNTAEMIVVGMGVKNALDFIDADPQRGQAVVEVRAGIDQVDLSLEHDDARHALAVGVPAVTLSRMDHLEVVPFYVVKTKGERQAVAFVDVQVQIDADGLLPVPEFEDVETRALHEHAVFDLHWFICDDQGVQQLVGGLDLPEGEFQLHAHDDVGRFRRHPGGHDLLFGNQTVITAENVLLLRFDLVLRSDDQRFGAGVVGMARKDQTLAVQHLQERELRQVGKPAVLHQYV